MMRLVQDSFNDTCRIVKVHKIGAHISYNLCVMVLRHEQIYLFHYLFRCIVTVF